MKYILVLILLLFNPALITGVSAQQRYEYSRPQMGTLFRIILYADSKIEADEAATAALNRVTALDSILSDYNPNSELSRLSATAGKDQKVKLGPDLWYVLQKSLQISEKTNGAFDVTIGPIVQLWRRARRQHELPSVEALSKAKNATGFRNVLLDKKSKTAQLLVPGMQLDMGAIGKGYAVDEAMKVLKKYGIKSSLVDGGGNILVSQAPPSSSGWEIDFLPFNAANPNANVKVILTNRGVATSGDLYQYVELNGQHYSHIVNPFTGLGLTDQSRVSIIAGNATDADWLSTSLSVLEPATGLKLIQKVPKAAAFIQKNNNGDLMEWQSGRYKKYLRKSSSGLATRKD